MCGPSTTPAVAPFMTEYVVQSPEVMLTFKGYATLRPSPLNYCALTPLVLPDTPAQSVGLCPLPKSLSAQWSLEKKNSVELECRVCTFIKASGDKTFYSNLKRALLGKAWVISRSATPAASGGGIVQILSQHQSSQSSTSTSLPTALLDLEALIIKAKEMVRVANDLSDHLATLKVDDDNTNASSLLTSFSNLAISKPISFKSTPVTQEVYKSDKAFLASLAQELSSILISTDTDPIIPLDRLWVKWNRARGVSFIPPSTFLNVVPLLQDTPHRLRQLGDMKILYAPHFSTASVAARLPSPVTPTSFSISERISLPLTWQLLLDEIEMLPRSFICRDDWETAIRPRGTVLEPTYYKNVLRDQRSSVHAYTRSFPQEKHLRTGMTLGIKYGDEYGLLGLGCGV
ncbi:Vacuolar protein-sorting-associated protein 36 [Marasmius sp. AFHP31]|nr:Vacuolar protein-sorting-associated protein 36 [Marasmius sp. AFHP31]